MLNSCSFLTAILLVLGTLGSRGLAQSGSPGEPSPQELFELRIMPIFNSPDPSSCVQCHLSAVDLKEYILPSHEQTFVSLRDQGLIDLDEPRKSKVLTLIRMGEKDLDEGARLIHEKQRRAEYEAFASWIKASAEDPRLRSLPPLESTERARPVRPNAVIRHARKSRVVDSFARNVWSQRMRCFPCHTPFEFDESNPAHQTAIKNQQKFEAEHPELVERMKIFQETPEATLAYLIEKSRHTAPGDLPLINLEDPRQSLLVRKPMSKLPAKNEDGTLGPPSSADPVSHMGGLKMHPDDQTYKAFVAWIEDYANVVGNRYASVEDLPADNWQHSQQVLKLMSALEDWLVATPVQMFVYAWNESQDGWEREPVAFTQGTVTPQRMVNGALILLSPQAEHTGELPRRDPPPASLPEGRYLVKVYVDREHRLAGDPTLLLGEEDFVGQAELARARWREGFRFAESISGKMLTRE